jgi:hypothetical protein
MTVAIGVNVDARQVKDARKAIEEMNGALRQTETMGPITGDDKHLSNTAGLIRNVADDINRMHRIAADGNRKGGLIDKNQFIEVEKINKRLLETFGAYIGKISLARDEVKKLAKEKENLLKKEQENGRLDPIERQRLADVDKRLEQRKRIVGRHVDRSEEMRMRLNSANESVQGFDQSGGGAGGGFNMKSIMKNAVLAYVGYKAARFITDGMEADDEFAKRTAPMSTRGGRDLAKGVGTYGYSIDQHLGIGETLLTKGNVRGSGLHGEIELAKQFSRGRGVSETSTADYMGSVAAFTGQKKLTETMEKLRGAIIQGEAGGRSGEFMERNLQILTKIANTRGGQIDTGQTAYLTTLQTALWQGKSPVGKGQSGQDIIGSLDNKLRSGGQGAGEQMLAWKALGGDGIKTGEDYIKYKRRLSEGASERNVTAYYDEIKKTYGQKKGGGLSTQGWLALSSILPNLAPEQIDKIIALGDSGMLGGDKLKNILNTPYGDIEKDAKNEMETQRGNSYAAVDATVEGWKLKTGETPNRVKREMQKAGVQAAEKSMDFVKKSIDRKEVVPGSEQDVLGVGGRGGYTKDSQRAPDEYMREAITEGFSAAMEKGKNKPQLVIVVGREGQGAAFGADR